MAARTANLLGALAQAVADGQGQALEQSQGLSGSAAAALVTMGHAPGQTIDFLSQVLRRSHSSVVRLVATLDEEGLATKRSAEDARAVALELTPAGQRVARNVLDRRNEALLQCLAGLDAQEVELLDRVLGKLLAALVDRDELRAYQICRFCDGEICDPCPVEDSFD